MKYLLFYCGYGLLWLVGHLPFKILYLKSDFLFRIIYYIIPYRKKLVLTNLKNSFPDWDDKRIKDTAKRFYRHFCDLWLESVAGGFKSEETMRKRLVFKNPELCNELYEKGKSITMVMSHYGNWEWTNTIQLLLKHRVLAIYKPLNNKYFDKFFKSIRERFGIEAVAMEKIFKVLLDHKNRNIPTLTLFLADQRPMRAQIQHWLNFMNQETPVVLGPEKISKKLDMSVVFLKIIPIKRGFYEAEFILLFEDAVNTYPYEITDSYYKLMEDIIKEKPEYWLWTHKRWKHKRIDPAFQDSKS